MLKFVYKHPFITLVGLIFSFCLLCNGACFLLNEPWDPGVEVPQNIAVGMPKEEVIARYGPPDEEFLYSKRIEKGIPETTELYQNLRDGRCETIIVYHATVEWRSFPLLSYAMISSYVLLDDEDKVIRVVNNLQ